MNRTDVANIATNKINACFNCILLNLPTGFGKTKIAIDIANYICDRKTHINDDGSVEEVSILIVVAKRVHKQVWLDELKKWGIHTDNITIECYESLKKYKDTYWDAVIYDEFHHINTETRLSILQSIHAGLILGLSATIPYTLRQFFNFNSRYKTYMINATLQDAINEDILPSPTILLYPQTLDDKQKCEMVIVNPKCKSGNSINIDYKDRWKYKRVRDRRIVITCTQKEYYAYVTQEVEYYKNRMHINKIFKNMCMRKCLDRLHWLSNRKNILYSKILSYLNNYRTVTFCNSIEQTELLGKYCINSKNKKSEQFVKDFNDGKIDHITSCNMLNESVNLKDCQIGMYANLNASDIIARQRMGRLLRHTNPVVIIPYFKSTRENEIVDKMMAEYDESCIHTIKNLSDIVKWL